MKQFRHFQNRMIFGVLVCLGALLAGFPVLAQTNSAALRPNIIWIVADDLGYGDLGCYGQQQIKTPYLDKLAAEGMRFRNFYAGSTVCAPSRCALMTGFHTGHAFVRGNAELALRPEDITVAEVLKGAGYHTGLIGKWGLGLQGTTGVPQRKGFDQFLGYLDQTHAHDYFTDHLWRYDGRSGRDQQSTFIENQDGAKGLYIPELLTTAATNFARLNKPDRFNKYPPFFLYLAYTLPHANNEEGRRTGNGMQVPSDVPYTGKPWPQVEKNKAAMITFLDHEVGVLLARLKQLRLEESTLILFTSDNGPHQEGGVNPAFFQSAGPLRGIKRDLYEGGIRVPMIVRWPGRIKPGQVSDQIWAFWDLLPTAAEVARAEMPRNIDGISMLPTLLGQTQTNQHEFLYWEFHEKGFSQAARSGDWKAVRLQPGKPLELYNLQTDLAEQHDVASENPAIVARFEAYLKTARTDSKEFPITPAGASVTNSPPAPSK